MNGLMAAACLVAGLAPTPSASAEDGAPDLTAPEYAPAQNVDPKPGKIKRPNASLSERAAGQAEQNAPLVMTGTATDTAGTPLADIPIRLDLEPSRASVGEPGVASELVKLSDTKTDGSGEFTFRTRDLGDLTGYQESDGSVSVLVSSLGRAATVYQHLIMRPATKPGGAWTMAVPDGDVTGRTPGAVGAATRKAFARSGKSAPVNVSLKAKRTPSKSRYQAYGVSGQDRCGGTFYWQRSTANLSKQYVRVNRAYVKNRVKWEYRWSNSSTTQVDASANVGSGGALVAAGYVNVQTSSAGMTSVADGNIQYDARREYNFYPYYLYCINGFTGATEYSGVYEWRPYSWTGASAFGSLNTAIFNCDSRFIGNLGGTTWSSRDATLQYSIGATLGANLRSAQTHNSSHSLYLYLRPGYTGASICGYQGDFINATQVREL